jgi:hypothetical protein
MNKLLISIFVIVMLIIFFVFNSSNEEIKNPVEESVKIGKKSSVNDKFITEMKENNNITKHSKIKKIVKENNKIEKNNNKTTRYYANNNLNNTKNKGFIFDEKEFDDFVDKNNLEEVDSVNENIKIYAKNLPVKNNFAPPMPPVLIKVKFNKSTKVIPLDSNVISTNKKLYVVNEKSDDPKKIELKEIDTKDLSSFTPPAIGQN